MKYFNTILKPKHYKDAELNKFAKKLYGHNIQDHHQWEHAILFRNLDKLGVSGNILDIGGMCETLQFHVLPFGEVYALDLFGRDDPHDFADALRFFNEREYRLTLCPSEFKKYIDCLHCIQGDAVDEWKAPVKFDYVFTLSAIEHFLPIPHGNSGSGSQIFMNWIDKIMNPGGYLLITTEMRIDGGKGMWYFDYDTLFSDIVNCNPNLSLISAIDIETPWKKFPHFHPGQTEGKGIPDYYKARTDGPKVWTEIMLILQKK